MSAFGSLDTGLPMMANMTTEQKLRAIEDYLVQLLEQLRYTLNNLGAENFNETDLKNIGEVITAPIEAEINDPDNGLSARISANADGIETLVDKTGVNSLGQSETLYSRIDQTADGVKTTVAQSIKQYKIPAGITISVYGYGAPTAASAASHNNQYYLDQSNGKYYKSNGSTWALQGTCTLTVDDKQDSATLISTINQTAGQIKSEVIKVDNNTNLDSYISQLPNDITLAVQGNMANEWATGNTYYTEDVVKVTATSGGTTTVKFYRCKYAGSHTSAAGNKPGSGGSWTTYWDEIPNANVQSVISANLNGITLSYDNSQVAAADHNASYIKLTKDGTEIAGGKVFIENLDASTINTGTLNAGAIVLLNAFSVLGTDVYDQQGSCGNLGGMYSSTLNKNEIYIESVNGHSTLNVGYDGEDYVVLETSERTVSGKAAWVSMSPGEVMIQAKSDNTYKTLKVDSNGIYIRNGLNGTWHDLFDLI